MIYQGFSIMLSGMGTVFLFLVILIFTVMGVSAITISIEKKTSLKTSHADQKRIIAALAAAALHQRDIDAAREEG